MAIFMTIYSLSFFGLILVSFYNIYEYLNGVDVLGIDICFPFIVSFIPILNTMGCLIYITDICQEIHIKNKG